jgi:hypothetical protein
VQPPYSPDAHLATSFYFTNKIGVETTGFWVSRKYPVFCNAGLKRHPTKCVSGLLLTMAAPMEKLCAGTREVAWRWPHCSWWISKITLFYEPVSLLYSPNSYTKLLHSLNVYQVLQSNEHNIQHNL